MGHFWRLRLAKCSASRIQRVALRVESLESRDLLSLPPFGQPMQAALRGLEMAHPVVVQEPGAGVPDRLMANASWPGGLLPGAGLTAEGSESGPSAIFDGLLGSISPLDLAWSTNNTLPPGDANGGTELWLGNQPPPLPTGTPLDGPGPTTAPAQTPSHVVGRQDTAVASVNNTLIRLAGGANPVVGLSAGVSPPAALADTLRVIAGTLVSAVVGRSANSRALWAGAEVSTNTVAEVLPNALAPAGAGTAAAFLPATTATVMGTTATPIIENLAVRSGVNETTMPLLAGLLQPAVALDKFKGIFALPQLPSPVAESNWTDWAYRMLRSPCFSASMVALGGLELLRRYSRRSAGKNGGPIDVPEVTGPVGL